MEEAVQRGIRYGINRAYKHGDDPPPSDLKIDLIVEEATNDVMCNLHEIFEVEP